jgi:hypothetical protein
MALLKIAFVIWHQKSLDRGEHYIYCICTQYSFQLFLLGEQHIEKK